ncbi:MAG: CPBP family intramembrane glutamic endopeptidase [Polyangiaceae bacterium]|jgi:membrane protease YdiL (CAAX protease family)
MKRSGVKGSSDLPMSPLAAAMWTMALSLLEQVCVATTEALRPGGLTDVVNLTACDVLATSIVAVAIIGLQPHDLPVRTAFGLRPCARLALVVGAVAGAGSSPVLSALDDRILRMWPYDDPTALENMEKLLARSSRAALVVGIFVVIPLARELFFRGLLYGRLRRSAPATLTVAVTAVLFAGSSLDWRAMPSALLLGLALGWVRERTGSVVPAVAAHLGFWAVAGVPILRGRNPAADVSYPATWIVVGAAIALVALGLIGRLGRADAAEA